MGVGSVAGPPYAAARAVASKVELHFARHLDAATQNGNRNLAPKPEADVIETIVNGAFWASLRREEGLAPKISLALVPAEQAVSALVFERSLPLTADALTHVAPAVERPGIHLGIWHDGGELRVWGTTRTLPAYCMVVEVVAPGLLVVKHRGGGESGKFVNVAVLEGDQVKVVDQLAITRPACPSLLSSLLGYDSTSESESVNVLVQLAVSMRAHGRGGSLLVVPPESRTWGESIVRPIDYSVLPPFSELHDLMREDTGNTSKRRWQDALRRSVDAIAGLTAVDGATVITDRYDLLAFGAKIRRRDGSDQVERVLVTEPVEGSAAEIVHPSQLGGTRHLSAAQFAHDQHDAIAMVASQDGRFTVFGWSPCEDVVHAHRLEALLL